LRKTEYSECSQIPQNVLGFLNDSGQALEMKFPELENPNVMVMSCIFCVAGLVFILIFIWHAWSVKYLIIEEIMKESSAMNFRHNHNHG
jgi:hypothetical protein